MRRTRYSPTAAGVAIAAAMLATTALRAQERPPVLDPLITTATRSASPLSRTPASVTRLSAEEVRRIPQATFADVLRTVPGFSIVDFDGLGFDPQVITRGFYGGGEAEYVVVLLDGKPLNQVHTGRAVWEALPSGTQIEAIEIVRGGASAIYGDAAVGGVINIVSAPVAAGTPWRSQADVGGGSFGLKQGAIRIGGPIMGRSVSFSGAATALDGFRDRAERLTGHGRVRAVLAEGDRGRLELGFLRQRRTALDPGPLSESAARAGRTQSEILFRFDSISDVNDEVSLDGHRRLGAAGRLTWFGVLGWRELSSTRTVALAPGFGDTQAQDLALRRSMANVQYVMDEGLPARGELLVGVEVQTGDASSRYFAVAGGPAAAYAHASGSRGDALGGGDADRRSLAAYAQYALPMGQRTRLSVGGRYDRLADRLTPQGVDAARSGDITHEAFSPKLGVTVQVARRTSAHASVGRSFKAPTLHQLFDQRAFPVPFPPFAIRSSSTSLRPATGTNVEAGGTHALLLGARSVLSFTFSAYEMRMRNEIDFDVATLSYGNIAQSRHRGVEAGTRLTGPGSLTGFVSYTVQAATLDGGVNDGNQIKAIPRHTWSVGASQRPRAWLSVGVFMQRMGAAFFDDANTRRIAAWERVDARVAADLLGATLIAEARNLFDARYVSTGFLDPAGSGAAFVHPAAGRVLQLGLRWGAE